MIKTERVNLPNEKRTPALWWGQVQMLVKKYNSLETQEKMISGMAGKEIFMTYPRIAWAKRDIKRMISNLVEEDPELVIPAVSNWIKMKDAVKKAA